MSDLDVAIDWYTRFFGRPPDLRVGDEILWDIDPHATLFIEPGVARAGTGRITLAVIGLDEPLARLTAHGIEHGPVETYGNGVRHVNVPDPDGNAIALAEPPASLRWSATNASAGARGSFSESHTAPVDTCHPHDMSLDPAIANPEHYKVVFENDRVRVLEYLDVPGDSTTPHRHPDSVMYTLSSFRRRLISGDAQREVELQAGTVGWLPAQEHHGENIGDTPTHVIFVELKESATNSGPGPLGPQSTSA